MIRDSAVGKKWWKGKGARKRPEQTLQIAVADYLRVALRPPTIWTAFPAGGGGRMRGAFLKAMGLQAGWPDILVIHPSMAIHGLPTVIGIELKTKDGRWSVEQKRVSIDFQNAGCIYRIARSVEEVEVILRKHAIPLHATVLGGPYGQRIVA